MGARVLVVDDDPVIQTLLKDYLGSCGFAVEVRSGGNECLEYLSQQMPDVLILDMVMPDMTGVEVLKKIREGGTIKGVPVILLSAEQTLALESDPTKPQADRYLQKPFEMRKIKEAIEALVAKGPRP